MNLDIVSLLLLGQQLSEAEPPYQGLENLVKIAIGIFSILLLALSISAYRRTRMRRLIYASIAFGLFAVQLFLEYLEDTVESFETAYSGVIFYAITLAILLLFFVSIVRRA
jgi:hypothetical protein